MVINIYKPPTRSPFHGNRQPKCPPQWIPEDLLPRNSPRFFGRKWWLPPGAVSGWDTMGFWGNRNLLEPGTWEFPGNFHVFEQQPLVCWCAFNLKDISSMIRVQNPTRGQLLTDRKVTLSKQEKHGKTIIQSHSFRWNQPPPLFNAKRSATFSGNSIAIFQARLPESTLQYIWCKCDVFVHIDGCLRSRILFRKYCSWGRHNHHESIKNLQIE